MIYFLLRDNEHTLKREAAICGGTKSFRLHRFGYGLERSKYLRRLKEVGDLEVQGDLTSLNYREPLRKLRDNVA